MTQARKVLQTDKEIMAAVIARQEARKEVGAWLGERCITHHPGWYRCDCPGCVRNLAYALLGGKMPE